MRKTTGRIVFLFTAILASIALGAELYVTPDGAGNRDGSGWDNAFAGIQAAVDAVDAAWMADNSMEIPVI